MPKKRPKDEQPSDHLTCVIDLPSDAELDKLAPPEGHQPGWYERLLLGAGSKPRTYEKARMDNALFVGLTSPFGLDTLRSWMGRKDYLADRRQDEETWDWTQDT